MKRKELGNRGEERVARYLQDQGWILLERNYRFERKEIDIIARMGDLIVFVEVKTRARNGYGKGMEAVDDRKRRRIARVAAHYLALNTFTDVNVRFDVASLDGDSIEYIENAFQLD